MKSFILDQKDITFRKTSRKTASPSWKHIPWEPPALKDTANYSCCGVSSNHALTWQPGRMYDPICATSRPWSPLLVSLPRRYLHTHHGIRQSPQVPNTVSSFTPVTIQIQAPAGSTKKLVSLCTKIKIPDSLPTPIWRPTPDISPRLTIVLMAK
jgi:hypothetical protein